MHLFRLNDSLTRECRSDQSSFSSGARFLIVGVLGSSISIISLLENLILFYVFATSRKLRRQNYANPVLLALFDAVVSLGYLFIESVHLFAFRLDVIWLALLWAKHVRIAYCCQHIALTVSNFLLVVASLERYLANSPHHYQKRILVFVVRYKVVVIVFILVLALLFKATILLENEILELPHCTEMLIFVPIWKPSAPAAQTRFWLRKIFTIILPFFILAYCNFYIVMHLRSRRRFYKSNAVATVVDSSPESGKLITRDAVPPPAAESPPSQSRAVVPSPSDDAIGTKWNNTTTTISETTSQQQTLRCSPNCRQSPNNQKMEKRGVRIATRTLVMVVGCYLISNSMTTVINIWEDFNPEFLRYEHFDVYFIASDIAVLLTICGCALRLPIYVSNDRRIRNAIIRALLRCRYCHRRTGLKTLAANANIDCEKWSIIIVSNSLKSNITGFLSQMDVAAFKEKKSFDQLAILVQNRRRFLVQMTINLGTVEELTEEKESIKVFENDEPTCLTDLHDVAGDGHLITPAIAGDVKSISKDDGERAAANPSAKREGDWILESFKQRNGMVERKHSTVIVRKRN